MKKKMSYKNFCEERGLAIHANESQAEFLRYSKEFDIENRVNINKIREEAQGILSKFSKKK